MNRWTVRLLVLLFCVTIASCVNQKKYLPTSPEFQGALSLSTEVSTLPADGFSTTTVMATISANADQNLRTVVFSTTAGTFSGTGTPEQQSKEVTADGEGHAVVQLRSSRAVDTARVTVQVKTVAGLTKTVTVTFTAVAPSDLIHLVVASNSAPADGASTTAVRAEIAAGLLGAGRTVHFTTTLGTFAETGGRISDNGKAIDQDADGSNQATVLLQSPGDRAGDALITASILSAPSVSSTGTLRFVAALPDAIRVSTNTSSLTASFNSTAQVTVTLTRNVGKPTVGTVVQMAATDASNKSIAFFSNVTTSNSDGVVTMVFTPGSAAVTGPAILTATVSGSSVSGSATIQIVPAPLPDTSWGVPASGGGFSSSGWRALSRRPTGGLPAEPCDTKCYTTPPN